MKKKKKRRKKWPKSNWLHLTEKQKQSVTNILTSRTWKRAWDLREEPECKEFVGMRSELWGGQPCNRVNLAPTKKTQFQLHIHYAQHQYKPRAYEAKLVKVILVLRLTEGIQSLPRRDKALPLSLLRAKLLKLTDFLQQPTEWGLGRRLNEASVSCNGQNESRSCLTSVSQPSCPALWITDSSPGQTAQDESCILTKSSSSLKCFLAAWTNTQTAYQIKGTLLGVSGWLTHASLGVSVTPLGSNATPARALWDIMTPCVRFCRKHF